MSHFYLPGNWSENTVVAPDSLKHHLRVRRMRSDEIFRVFNGAGKVAQAQLHPNSNEKTCLLTLSEMKNDVVTELPYRITLIQGLAANEKMDWVIEKAVELGVTHIIPIQTERSIIRFDEKKIDKKLNHWQQIMVAACEQCDRTMLPTISIPQTLPQFLAEMPPTEAIPIYLSPTADLKFVSVLKRSPGQELMLMVGPEGGFSPLENQHIDAKGFIGVSLGKRILRTETAGIVALAATHAIWGQL